MISSFRGKYYFLSNFSDSRITINGHSFLNAEAAFHSFKDLSRQYEFKNLDPSSAKRLGRRVRLRSDWEEIKDDIMYQVVKDKFTQNEILRVKLLNTGDEYLEEDNVWHDNYWGVCQCVKCQDKIGKNKLGKILMRVREELRGGN